jgi:hypothetical protein
MKQDLKIISCVGNNYEIGFSQGKLLKKQIKNNIHNLLNNNKYFPVLKFLPIKTISGLTGSYIDYKFKQNSNDKILSLWNERLQGIIDGAKSKKNIIKSIQILEALYISLGTSFCTSFAFHKSKTNKLGPIILKNYDIADIIRPFSFLRYCEPKNKFKNFEMALSVQPGSHTLINEKGLCISFNFGVNVMNPNLGILPTFIAQYAIENFSTTNEFVHWINNVVAAQGCIFTVCDKNSKICVIEKIGSITSIRKPINGTTVASNHYVSDSMKLFNFDINSTYSKTSPDCLKNISVNKSNIIRYKRGRKLLNKFNINKQKINLDDIIKIASDHNGKKEGGEESICRHHPILGTAGSLILQPKDNKIQVCNGKPCKVKYKEIDLNKYFK